MRKFRAFDGICAQIALFTGLNVKHHHTVKLKCSKMVHVYYLQLFMVVFWCIMQRVTISTIFIVRKDIQYAHSSGAQIHEVPQSRFCFFRLS